MAWRSNLPLKHRACSFKTNTATLRQLTYKRDQLHAKYPLRAEAMARSAAKRWIAILILGNNETKSRSDDLMLLAFVLALMMSAMGNEIAGSCFVIPCTTLVYAPPGIGVGARLLVVVLSKPGAKLPACANHGHPPSASISSLPPHRGVACISWHD
jgi:hypothetical protein